MAAKTVLLVDDEEIVIGVGRQMLEKLGFAVLTANNGKEALDVYKNNQNEIDFIILDMIMPKMTGLKLADAIMKYRSDIPIMICTGFKPPELDVDKSKTMIKKILMKPLMLHDLASSIREVLDGK